MNRSRKPDPIRSNPSDRCDETRPIGVPDRARFRWALLLSPCRLSLVALLVFLLVLPAFAGKKPGKDYGKFGRTQGPFLGKFWHYYERALSFAEGGFYEEAAEDLLEAIRLRPSDERGARTYGMHYIAYFPHRELGVCYHHLGRLEEAERELEASLKAVETDKARYYLDKTRKTRASRQQDAQPPRVTISSPKAGEVTNRASVKVSGSAEDDLFVEHVRINGVALDVTGDAKVAFERAVSLSPGENVIVVEARDLTGKVGADSIRVTVDREGPAVTVERPAGLAPVEAAEVEVAGTAMDPEGVQALKVGGRDVAMGADGGFIAVVALKEGENAIPFWATDRLGNATTGRVLVTRAILRPPEMKPPPEPKPLPPATSPPVPSLPPASTRPLEPGTSETVDLTPPEVRLNDLTEFQIVTYPSLSLDGSAFDPSGVKEVRVNGKGLKVHKAQTVFFSYTVDLLVGRNVFQLEAADGRGNTASKTVVIERRDQKVKQVASRLNVAVPPFVTPKDLPSSLAAGLDQRFIQALESSGRFHVVVRGGAAMQHVIDELKFSETGLVDPESAAKAGKGLSGAEAIFVGQVTEKATSVQIDIQLIDVESGEVIMAKDAFDEVKTEERMGFLVNRLARDFERGLPVLDGLVVKLSGDRVIIDLGSHNHLKRRMKVIVYREGEPIVHPVTGKVLGQETEELGEAVVEKVFEEMAEAPLKEAAKASAIRVGDKVITK